MGGLTAHSRSCGVGLMFVVFPWVSLVDPTPAWLLPGPSKQLTVPCSLVQLSGNGAPHAGAVKPLKMAPPKAIETRILRIIKFASLMRQMIEGKFITKTLSRAITFFLRLD